MKSIKPWVFPQAKDLPRNFEDRNPALLASRTARRKVPPIIISQMLMAASWTWQIIETDDKKTEKQVIKTEKLVIKTEKQVIKTEKQVIKTEKQVIKNQETRDKNWETSDKNWETSD